MAATSALAAPCCRHPHLLRRECRHGRLKAAFACSLHVRKDTVQGGDGGGRRRVSKGNPFALWRHCASDLGGTPPKFAGR
jgi:hypothetical protein